MPRTAAPPRANPELTRLICSIDPVERGLSEMGYIPNRQIAIAVFSPEFLEPRPLHPEAIML